MLCSEKCGELSITRRKNVIVLQLRDGWWRYNVRVRKWFKLRNEILSRWPTHVENEHSLKAICSPLPSPRQPAWQRGGYHQVSTIYGKESPRWSHSVAQFLSLCRTSPPRKPCRGLHRTEQRVTGSGAEEAERAGQAANCGTSALLLQSKQDDVPVCKEMKWKIAFQGLRIEALEKIDFSNWKWVLLCMNNQLRRSLCLHDPLTSSRSELRLFYPHK